jgi:hypothetical protein
LLLAAAAVIMVSSLVWLELSREAQATVSYWIRINWFTWLEPLTLMPTYFALPMATLRSLCQGEVSTALHFGNKYGKPGAKRPGFRSFRAGL